MIASSLLLAASALALEVSEIPSPRPAGWVTDQAGTLSAADVSRLNELGDRVKAQTGGELAVVLVPSLGGKDPRRFATDLFNHWGVGSRERNDGVLVFVSLGDRAAEIILGSGIDRSGQVDVSDGIMHGEMVPRFKAGDPSGAVVAGASACATRLLKLASGGLEVKPLPAPPSASGGGSRPWWPWGAGAGLLPILIWAYRRWERNRPRSCPKCRSAMVLLSESDDDAHLDAAEKTEERVGSVDYDVWFCCSCRHALKQSWGAWFTRYAKCPKCGAKTKSSADTTLEAATYSSGGRVRVDEVCAHCNFRNSYTRSTPRLEHSNSSSSSSSSSGFGGGSSSGGGSSGRW